VDVGGALHAPGYSSGRGPPRIRVSALRTPTLAACALFAASACGSPPERPCTDAVPPAAIATLCGFAKPEDVAWIASRNVLLVSEMGLAAPSSGGALSAVDAAPAALGARRVLWPRGPAGPPVEEPRLGDPTCETPPEPSGFSAHGLDAVPSEDAARVRVALVAHGAREAIELFDLVGEGEGLHLVWRGCVPLPPGTAGNDVAIGPAGELFVTNYLPTVHGLRALLALRAADRGEITGDVLAWSRERGWRHVAGSEASQPNGIAVSPDGATLFVAENGASRLVRMPAAGAREGSERTHLPLPGRPDNLSWSRTGALLAAVLHPGTPGGWSLVEIAPDSLRAVLRIEARDGRPLHSVTSAADAGARLYLGSMADDRIGVAARPGG
jgi:hypothetical protein